MLHFSNRYIRCAVAALTLLASACDSSPSTTGMTMSPDTGFHIVGDPEASSGATWTFRGNVAGVDYDLQGVLFKPHGPGPFPAVLLSHAADGNAPGYGGALGTLMVQWGLV